MDKRSSGKFFATLLVAVFCSSCASTPQSLGEKLDPATGVTVTYSHTPLIMYRDNSGRAAFSGSYVHMGPIQVNRSGDYQYYIWLSAWATMVSAETSERQADLESVLIFADGEPLSLEVAGWTPGTIGTSEPVYLKPVASAVDAYYRVTADQIRLIAEASDLRLRTSGPRSQEFILWDQQRGAKRGLREFVDQAFF